MRPILIQIGPLKIPGFGIMLVAAFLVGLFLIKKELARKRLKVSMVDSIVLAAMIGGIVGARLYFILEYWSEFLQDPLGMIFSGAGLVWYGGFILATLAIIWVIHHNRQPLLPTIDAIVPALVLGYGIGRIGCQLAGDGDYGIPSDLPWAMAYPNGIVPTTIPVHPTPIYETLLALLIFAVLWRLRRRIKTPGVLFCWGLMMMGLARFGVEFIRLNSQVAFGLTAAQLISVGLVLVGGLGLFILPLLTVDR